MFFKGVILVVALMSLCACMTATELRTKGPVASWNTSKDVASISACIADAWSKHHVTISNLPLAKGNSIQVIGAPGSPTVIADVTQSDQGASIRVYERASWGKHIFRQDVDGCI